MLTKIRRQTEGTMEKKKPIGRPRATTDAQDYQLIYYLEKKSHFPASRSTPSRILKKSETPKLCGCQKRYSK